MEWVDSCMDCWKRRAGRQVRVSGSEEAAERAQHDESLATIIIRIILLSKKLRYHYQVVLFALAYCAHRPFALSSTASWRILQHTAFPACRQRRTISLHLFPKQRRSIYCARSPSPPCQNGKRLGPEEGNSRLQYLGGTLTKNNILIPEPLPAYCTEFPNLVERISSITNVFRVQSANSAETTPSSDGKPNQLLINEYSAGQGIAPHEDGAAYHPAVATISLGSGQCLDLYQYLSETDPSPPLTHTMREDVNIPSSSANNVDDATTKHANGKAIAAVPLARVFLEPRSLFIMTGSLYQSHLHGISFSDTDILTSASVEGTPTSLQQGQQESDARPSPTSSNASSVPVANLPLLGDLEIMKIIEREGSYRSERGTRVSLTFRKVERVMKGVLGAGGGKGLLGLGKR